MSDDIVTRLRGSWDCSCLYIKEHGLDQKCLDCEAAHEIERLRSECDKWRRVADELYWSGNCSETCEDSKWRCDCSCSWNGAQWEYQKAVRGE